MTKDEITSAIEHAYLRAMCDVPKYVVRVESNDPRAFMAAGIGLALSRLAVDLELDTQRLIMFAEGVEEELDPEEQARR